MNVRDCIRFKDSNDIYRVKREGIATRPFIGQRPIAILDTDEFELVDEPPYVIVYETCGKLFISKNDALRYSDNPIERKVYG